MTAAGISLAAEHRARAGALRDLRAAGFTEEQAWSLATAGYGVWPDGGWPLGQVGLPIDEHLARIGATS